MHCHGSFYDFIAVLLKEEKRIARDYRVVMSGGDRVYVSRRKKYVTRDQHIKVVQKRLEDELIDVSTFLSQITFMDNVGTVNNMDTIHDGDEINSDDEVNDEMNDDLDNSVVEAASVERSDDGVINASHESTIARLQAEIETLRRANVCVVWLTSPRNTTIKSCGHVKTCQECTDYIRYTVRRTVEGDIIPPSCPLCRGPILGTERAYL